MVEVLDTNYFNLEYLKEITKMLFSYYGKFKTFPSYKLIVTLLREEKMDDILKEQIIGFLLKIKKDTSVSDIEYVKEESLDFCKKRALLKSLETSLSLIENKKYEQIIGEVQKALRAGTDKDIGSIYLDDFESRMQQEQYKPVPTPWPELNKRMKGGLGNGKLGVLAGRAGEGKSHFLVDVGSFAVMSNLNVVHYTLELNHIDIGCRYDARISEISFDDLLSRKEEVKEKINDKTKGKLIIKSYPTKKATVQTLRNHFNNLLLRGIKPDLILIDYADLLKSMQEYDAKRLNEEAVYEELRAWAMEINLPIWTVTQINREGMGVEVLTLKYVAECFAKAMIADVFLTMARDKSGPHPNIGNIFMAKNRLGPDGVKLGMLIDTSKSKIELLAPEFEGIGEDDSEEKQMESLRKKFKDFMNGKEIPTPKDDGSVN